VAGPASPPGPGLDRLGALPGRGVHSGLVDPYAEIRPSELKDRLDTGKPVEILDVREPWEHAICAIPGARLIPMDELGARVGELDPAREVVVYCHHGQRSAAVVQWLRGQGIPAVNLRGGIDGWAAEVDPALARY
jgi:sulfur-carrier protein adenylyltransferase/sulfurtransferase